jgi:hypothetical protein
VKIYVRANDIDTGDIEEKVGDFACLIHPDRTVDCFKFWVGDKSEAIYPNRNVKKALREKYGKDLIFMDDREKNTPINSIEEAEQIILNANVFRSARYYRFWEDECRRIKEWLINPNSTGKKQIGRIDSNRAKPTSAEFREVIKVNQDLFMAALQMLHPGKSVNLVCDHYNRDPYAHKGIYAEPAHTDWFITIE